MKIGFLQLSDIHFKEENNVFITKRQEAFFKAAYSKLTHCKKVIIIITGDVSFSGKPSEYEIAKAFLFDLSTRLKTALSVLMPIDFVLVPGNHDCCFQVDGVRPLVINSVLGSDYAEDITIRNNCLSVQENFWSFYSNLIGEQISPSVSHIREIPIYQDLSLVFHCYNTAFLSEINETPGRLLIPENDFLPGSKRHANDIIISLFHHNTGWLSPNTSRNNKKQFEHHLLGVSNIIMCGHEHNANNKVVTDLSTNDTVVYLEASALQDEKESAFLIDVFDTEEKSLLISEMSWSSGDSIYKVENEYRLELRKKEHNWGISSAFLTELERLSIPIKHPQKDEISLSEIFVYPDLEPLVSLSEKYVSYYDSEKLVTDDISSPIVFIEGEPQSGKTSLLKRLFHAFIIKGKYPLLINGADISNPNISSIIKRSYKEQYNYKHTPIEVYQQCFREEKVLLIDSFEKCVLNNAAKGVLFERLKEDYSCVIITSNDQTDIKNLLIQTGKDNEIIRYHLLPLGYNKRNTLIEKWVKLGKNVYTINDVAIEQEVKLLFEQITNLLGEQLIPAYPVFVLSLLQGLNQAMQQFDVSQTSYAFCYKSLIIGALFRSGVPGNGIEGIINFMIEFAYRIYVDAVKTIDRDFFEAFYNEHFSKFNRVFNSEKLLTYLCSANILREENGNIVYPYKYIYFYLIAAKISRLDGDNKDKIIKELCSSLQKEDAANILIFLIHHNQTGNNTLIEELLYASLLPFEHYTPISLDTDDVLFRTLSGFVTEIKEKILISDIDPHEERTKQLKQADENNHFQTKSDDQNGHDIDNDPTIIELNNAFKIIRILGQIVKNHRDTFEREDLITLIEFTYNACFRSVSFFTKLLNESKQDIVDYLIDKNHRIYAMPDKEIEGQVTKLIHLMLYRTCLSSFSNLSLSVGSSGMNSIFDDAAKRIGTPAAKIISFTIKTYYNRMTVSDLSGIVDEFRDNPVAMQIIRARVIHYVYNNSTDYQTRQALGQLCQLQLVNKAQVNASRNRK